MANRSGRIEQYPAPRPRRESPLKRVWALLALHEGRVLLQRRAPAGVWGGLYALPQFDSAAALRRAAGAIDTRPRLRRLPPRAHAFTHFTLALLPRRLDVRSPPPALREDDLIWLPLAAIDTAPLPAPVLALLREVAQAAPAASAGRSAAPRRRRKPA